MVQAHPSLPPTLDLPLEVQGGGEILGETSAEDVAEAQAEETPSENATPPTEDVESAQTTSGKGKESKKESKKEKEKADKTKKTSKKEKKESVLRKVLTVASFDSALSPPQWSSGLIAEAVSRLKALDAADAARKQKEAALNELEAYLYKTRNRIRDEEGPNQLGLVSTTEQRDELLELCTTIEEWLYEDGRDQSVSVYKSKQSSIKVKAEAIYKRYQEHKNRPEAVKKATHQLSTVRTLVAEWAETMPQITAEEKEKVLELVKTGEEWLEDNVAAQSKLTAYETPAFTSADVVAHLKPLTVQLEKLLKKPKPVPPKTSKTTNSTNETSPNATEGASDPETIHIELNEEAEAVPDEDNGDIGKEESEQNEAGSDEL